MSRDDTSNIGEHRDLIDFGAMMKICNVRAVDGLVDKVAQEGEFKKK